MAAAKALDMICGITIPDNAVMVRNLALMAEHIQSDIRHGILMFMKDFLNPLYENEPFYPEARLRYESFRGTSVIQAIQETKRILEIVAIVGGQWPNSSFMVPGGIATAPTFNDMISCNYIQKSFTAWYERQILGCSIERWSAITTQAELDAWLDENESHRNGDLGFFIRCARHLRPRQDRMRTWEFYQLSGYWTCRTNKADQSSPVTLMAAGCILKGEKAEFNQTRISEHVAFSRFQDYRKRQTSF